MELAISRANSAGVLFVAAAGNGGPDLLGDDNDQQPHFPSSYTAENIIAVAATGPNDEWARLPNQPSGVSFSNFGATSVDLAAPGEAILSTIPRGASAGSPQSVYARQFGTSMATPIVTGAVALMRAEFPSMNHLEIRELLLETVDPVPRLAGKVATGGRLNLLRALRPTPPPTPSETEVAVTATDDLAAEDLEEPALETMEISTAEAMENAKMYFRPGLSSFEQEPDK